jgi:hypothetical protein
MADSDGGASTATTGINVPSTTDASKNASANNIDGTLAGDVNNAGLAMAGTAAGGTAAGTNEVTKNLANAQKPGGGGGCAGGGNGATAPAPAATAAAPPQQQQAS